MAMMLSQARVSFLKVGSLWMLSAIQVRKYDVSGIPNNDSGCKLSVSGKDKVSFVMRIYRPSREYIYMYIYMYVYILVYIYIYIYIYYSLSFVQLFVTPWTIDCQAPLSMGIL